MIECHVFARVIQGAPVCIKWLRDINSKLFQLGDCRFEFSPASICRAVTWCSDCISKRIVTCSSTPDASGCWSIGWVKVCLLYSSTTVRKYLWAAVHETSILPFVSKRMRLSLSEKVADSLNCVPLFPFVQSINSSAFYVVAGSKQPNLWFWTYFTVRAWPNLPCQR